MLQDAGVEFTSSVARIDEESVKQALEAERAPPVDIADTLAEMKALRISARNRNAVVIGSDQVLAFEGQILGKPSNIAEARAQLLALRGKTHKLLSAAVIAEGGQPVWRYVGQVRLTMRDFSDTFLEEYLDSQGVQALETVGAYKLEEEGVRLFAHVEGDFFTVLGMPLIEVLTYLSDKGVLLR